LKFNQTIERFQQTNEKAFYLAFLRVALSTWYLAHFFFRWQGLELFYSNHSSIAVNPSSSLYLFHINPELIKQHYLILVYTCIGLLIANILGIGRNIISVALFLALLLLNGINDRITNGGDVMALLLAFYLAIANTFSYFTLFKRKPFSEPKERVYNLLSNLAAYSIMINLALAYFFAGLFKLVDPYWQNGTALHYFLNDDRYSVFAAGQKYVEFPAIFLYIINYGTLLLELTFPVLICYKKYRSWVLLLCFIMHLGIYTFLMVYAMSVTFVIQYGIFYSNEEMLALAGKIRARFRKVFSFAVK